MTCRVVPERRFRVRQFILGFYCNPELSDCIVVPVLRHCDLALYQCVSDRQQHRRGVVNGVEKRYVGGISKRLELRVFRTGSVDVTLVGISCGTNVVPDCRRVLEIRRWLPVLQVLRPSDRTVSAPKAESYCGIQQPGTDRSIRA